MIGLKVNNITIFYQYYNRGRNIEGPNPEIKGYLLLKESINIEYLIYIQWLKPVWDAKILRTRETMTLIKF